MTINSVTAALFTWQALKLTLATTYFWPPIRFFGSHALKDILCFPCIERRSHSTQQKLFSFHITNEILGLYVVKTTPSLRVLLCLYSCVVVFTSSLIRFFFFFVYSHSLTFVFVEPIPNFFPWGSLTQMASYNQEFHSRLLAVGFAFSFGQHESVGRSLTFRVLASSRGRLISEEIR